MELIGTTPNAPNSTGLNAQSSSNGKAGDLRIETGRLSIRNGAQVNVSSSGTGDAGNLQVQANSIRLDNGGRIYYYDVIVKFPQKLVDLATVVMLTLTPIY